MLAQELLLESLENLRKDDFDKFKWYLSMNVLPDCKPIPESHLEDAQRTKTVTMMIKSYGEDLAVSLTIEILKKIQNNNAAEKLDKAYKAGGKRCCEGEEAVTSSSSALAAAAPPPATLLAQQGSVIFAPTVTSSTSGSWNITINK